MSANRAERRLCKKRGHPYAKVMPDGSVACTLCGVTLRDSEPPRDDGREPANTPDSGRSAS